MNSENPFDEPFDEEEPVIDMISLIAEASRLSELYPQRASVLRRLAHDLLSMTPEQQARRYDLARHTLGNWPEDDITQVMREDTTAAPNTVILQLPQNRDEGESKHRHRAAA